MTDPDAHRAITRLSERVTALEQDEHSTEWAVEWHADDGSYEPADSHASAQRALDSGGREYGRIVRRIVRRGPWTVAS